MYLIEVTRFGSFVALVGRACLAMVFLFSGLEKILHWETNVYVMSGKGLPCIQLLLAVAVVVELLGGLSLLTGVMARASALLLVAYLFLVTAIFHFIGWGPTGHTIAQLMQTMKNLSIMGGLFMLSAYGPGPLVLQERHPTRGTIAELRGALKAEGLDMSEVPAANPMRLL